MTGSTAMLRTKAMHAFVASNPGSNAPAIAAGIGAATCAITGQLAEMTARGDLYRAGLRFAFVYYATAAERDASAAQVQATQQANRIAKYKAKQARSNAAKRALRAAHGIPRETWHVKVLACIDAHQGATRAHVHAALPDAGHSTVGHILSELSLSGALIRMTETQTGQGVTPAYFTSREAYEAARLAPPPPRTQQKPRTSDAQSRTDLILAFVKSNPGSKAPAIAANIGTATSNVGSQLAEMVDRGQVYRAGLRCEYVYYSTAAERDATAETVLAEQTADRAARRKEAFRRRYIAKRVRIKAIRAGDFVKTVDKSNTWAQKFMRWLAQPGHQGATRAEVEDSMAISHHTLGHVITSLKRAGMLWHTGKQGDKYDKPRYYTDPALFAAALAAPPEPRPPGLKANAKVETLARRAERKAKKDAADLLARQVRAASKATKAAAREAARLELERTAADNNQRRQAAADAKREAREIAERAKQEAKAARHAVAPRVTTKTVAVRRADADAWRSAKPIITKNTKITVCPGMPDRFAVHIQLGQGTISQDQLARRRGAEVPTRLAGAYA